MRGPAVTCFRRDRFLFHESVSGPAASGCLFSRRRRGGSPQTYEREGRRAPTCHVEMCVRAAQRGVRDEILGRDIGPQATNSYDDIDSYTESSGDVCPARRDGEPHRHTSVSMCCSIPDIFSQGSRPIFCSPLARLAAA